MIWQFQKEKTYSCSAMRESKFISNNSSKWKKFEDNIQQGNLAAEEMESAFVELNDDLAYARTFYKNRAVRLFLNNLLTRTYSRIYRGKKWNLNQLGNFFLHEVPRANYSARKLVSNVAPSQKKQAAKSASASGNARGSVGEYFLRSCNGPRATGHE